MSNINRINCQLADLLGITYKGLNVVAFGLKCEADKAPIITVTRQIYALPAVDDIIATEHRRYTLVPMDGSEPAEPELPPPDLDQMERDAKQRLVHFIEDMSDLARKQLRHDGRRRWADEKEKIELAYDWRKLLGTGGIDAPWNYMRLPTGGHWGQQNPNSAAWDSGDAGAAGCGAFLSQNRSATTGQ